MYRFSYKLKGMTIHFAIKDKSILLKKLDELASLAFRGKIHNIIFFINEKKNKFNK